MKLRAKLDKSLSKFGLKQVGFQLVQYLLSIEPFEADKEELLTHLKTKGHEIKVSTFHKYISELMSLKLVQNRRVYRGSFYRSIEKSKLNRMAGLKHSRYVRKHIVSEDGFVSNILELARANGFESVCRVHDVNLSGSHFWSVEQLRRFCCVDVWDGESRFSWKWNDRARSWRIQLFVQRFYRVTFQLYAHGKLLCKVKCLRKPIPDRLIGLRRLDRVISEACFIVFRGKQRFVSEIDKWIVTFWHFARDSKRRFDVSFNVLFTNFLDGLARIYIREEDGRLRLEIYQNPNVALGALIGEKEGLAAQNKQLIRETQAFEKEKKQISRMVASCFLSCVNESGKLIDFEKVQ